MLDVEVSGQSLRVTGEENFVIFVFLFIRTAQRERGSAASAAGSGKSKQLSAPSNTSQGGANRLLRAAPEGGRV
jgi:hypothetical protein